MVELFLYQSFGDELLSTAALNLCFDCNLDPKDQDHAGVNFNFQIRNLNLTLLNIWTEDSQYDDCYLKFDSLKEEGREEAIKIPNGTDSFIVGYSWEERVNFTLVINDFITNHTSLVINNLASPRDEYVRFLGYLDEQLKARDDLYRSQGIYMG